LFKQVEGRNQSASSCGIESSDDRNTDPTDPSPRSFWSSDARPRTPIRRSTIMSQSSPPTQAEKGCRMHRPVPSRSSNSGYGSSLSGDELRKQAVETSAVQKQTRGSKTKWLSQVKDWLSTSEPSAEALKAQKSRTSKRPGLDPKNPKAASKQHMPSAKLPPNVTTSTAGPTPEKALKQTLKEQRLRQSFSNANPSTPSVSSRDSLASSVKHSTQTNTWEW